MEILLSSGWSNLLFGHIFPANYMKMKKLWPPPPRSDPPMLSGTKLILVGYFAGKEIDLLRPTAEV